METRWSDYQRAIFSDVAEGKGHTVVMARAGTGKTSTIMEAMRYVPVGRFGKCSTAMFAFNKRIATELKDRAPNGVRVSTLHSFGFAAVRRAFRNVKVEARKSRKLLDNLYPPANQDRMWCAAAAKTAGIAKGLLATSERDIDHIIDRFHIDYGADDDLSRPTFIEDVMWLLDESAACTTMVDFDDMIWFPIRHNLKVETFDRVFVDETQDLNACQLELTIRACRNGGRICAVGDEKQAIYQFRGADKNAVRRIINRLDAKVLPLSITYRCGKAITQLAAQEVEDFEAADSNPEGMVQHCTKSEMIKSAAPGDFILSRVNAPLIGLCMGFLKQGRAANIAGRDVGAGLISLIERSKAESVDDLLVWIEEWKTREIDRRLRRDSELDVTDIEDRADCITALSEGETSISHVIARVESLFSDKNDADRIILSTTHKAKGLERDRVWMLADTYHRDRGCEEANIWYVAVTRARHELWMVKGNPEA